MPSIKEPLELLDRIQLCSGLTKRNLRGIANLVKEVDHPAGKTIVRQGKRAHAGRTGANAGCHPKCPVEPVIAWSCL